MKVIITEFRSHASEIFSIREIVFEREQGVPTELERDGLDPDCIHVLAFDENERAIGTGRLQSNGKIGRMAVLKDWRRKGVGGSLLSALLKAATDRPLETLYLYAQIDARPFYEKFGFNAVGREFMEAGITHIEMHRAGYKREK